MAIKLTPAPTDQEVSARRASIQLVMSLSREEQEAAVPASLSSLSENVPQGCLSSKVSKVIVAAMLGENSCPSNLPLKWCSLAFHPSLRHCYGEVVLFP